MKKTVFFMMILAVVLAGCKKSTTKSEEMIYEDTNPIKMVLKDTHKIAVSSDYDINYEILNTDTIRVLRFKSKGVLEAINYGTDKVRISNGYNTQTVDVVVDLFTEPTFEFGCNSTRIRELFGAPSHQPVYMNDTVLAYRYTAPDGYSYSCGEIDFFFNRGHYFLSAVYTRPTVDYALEKYLKNNFTLDTIMGDTISIYRLKSDNTIVCEKSLTHNEWNEFILLYYKVNSTKSDANFLNNRPRSSKFLY